MLKFLKPEFFLFPIIFFGVFGLSNFSWAAPSITSAPSSATDGQSITISGSAFGTGATVYKWDDFENGTDGAILTGWTMDDSDKPKYTTTNQRNARSTKSAYCDIGTEDITYDHGGILGEFYLSYWVRRTFPDPTTPYPSSYIVGAFNHKELKVNHSSFGGLDGQPALYIDQIGGPPPASNNTISGEDCNNDGFWDSMNGCADAVSHENGTWERVEVWAKESQSSNGVFNGVADGFFKVWFHRPTEIDQIENVENTLTNCSGYSQHWQRITLDYSNTNAGLTPEDIAVWIDDIAIASSPARIEIGNNADWDLCTHREIQIPTAWDGVSATNTITATVNQGSFQNGDTAYLFVIDENGEPSAGREITIGGEPDATSPGAPSGLSVS